MEKDIVCAEAELSSAANKIVAYGDLLSRTIEAYIGVLAQIQEKGIHDNLVCAKLSSIAQSLQLYKTSIPEDCENISQCVADYIADVADADKFNFPGDAMSSLKSLVSKLF